MAQNKRFDPQSILTKRKKAGLNQNQFWSRYGVTQSGGSRYESGREIPLPTSLLIWLHENQRVTDQDLADAVKAVSKSRK